MKYLRLLTFVLVAIVLAVMPLVGACTSEEAPAGTIELSYATSLPNGHPWTLADLAWIDKVEKETNGRVHFTVYAGATLVSSQEDYRQLVNGIADVARAEPSYVPVGFDIRKAWGGFFYGVPSQEIQQRVCEGIWSKFPETVDEYAEAKVLGYEAVEPYHVLTSKKAVRTIEDFEGLQLKALPHYIGPLKELGAVGMGVPMGETYINAQKGIIDGLMGPYEVLSSFKLAEVIKYATRLDMYGGFNPNRFMNLASWNNLPADIQKVFEDNIEFWTLQNRGEMDKATQAGIDLGKELGVEFIEMPAGDLAKFYAVFEAEAIKAAEELDAKGLPGTEIFREVRRLIEEYS